MNASVVSGAERGISVYQFSLPYFCSSTSSFSVAWCCPWPAKSLLSSFFFCLTYSSIVSSGRISSKKVMVFFGVIKLFSAECELIPVFYQASMPPIPGDPPQQMHPSGQPHVPGNAAPGIQGMSQPGSPAGNQPGSANSRIDPNQIPRPQPTVTPVTYVTRVENQSNVPPVH